MGLANFLKFALRRFFNLLAWPSFTLLCPLYASIRAVESNNHYHYQQCLNYWVLFSITTILEHTFSKLLMWVPFWHSLKGIASFFLSIPSFCGASCVYTCFVRPFVLVNLRVFGIPLIQKTRGCMSNEKNELLDTPEQHAEEKQREEMENFIMCEGISEFNVNTDDYLTCTVRGRKVQNEWTCALCLVSTSSEKCLRQHFRGKKHKAMEAELRETPVVTNSTVNVSAALMRTNMVFERFKQIRRVNFGGILRPSKSFSWCTWTKPKFGWTKLNTDGSVDRENAGFGGLLRDFRGKSICAYVSKAPLNDIFLVELWAIWRGLVLASGFGIKMIWVESDSMSSVKTINKEQPYGPKASSCLLHIWELLRKFEKYQVSHAWRESNRAADYLSKMGLLGSDVVLAPIDFPSSLQKIIEDDANGRIYRRG